MTNILQQNLIKSYSEKFMSVLLSFGVLSFKIENEKEQLILRGTKSSTLKCVSLA